jgi:transcriptional regulator with XRE-family HTH domain
MTFGKWLASKRAAVGFTQLQLAERCGAGISASYISALEREEPNTKDRKPRQPRRDKVERIAKALGVTKEEALDAAGYKVAGAEKPRNVLEFVRALEALGVSHIEMFGGPDVLAKMTPDDFESILSEVRRAVEREIFKKARE